ncbi:MAG: CBS domain-containing protein [Cryomorphaceae bacterium]|jgi:pentose-5-phosphate-3-epimerase|nr:CBS domain-containing protein [Cryomorphaceae bacterium]
MKISASVYSDKKRPLKEVIEDLVQHQVDLLHIDCNDDPKVFDDIREIRSWCDLPIDLHIITAHPEKYYELLRENPVEYVTFQFEDLQAELNIPGDIGGKKGLAIITPTPVEVFDQFADFDFILIMATIPGQSGGVFDSVNFSKIRQFRKRFPNKSIHVDGGVNGEVSFILRNMGVSSSVSGSYLFNAPSIGHALMNLTKRSMESHFKVKDFMIPLEECPVVTQKELSLRAALTTIENGKLGFCLVTGEEDQFLGIISSADIRRSLLNKLEELNSLNVDDMINKEPVLIDQECTVVELLQCIKRCSFPVMYLPVLKFGQKAAGIVNFVNLVKGEL